MENKATFDFKKADLKTAFSWLQATDKGLSEQEAAKRANELGFNEVSEKKQNLLLSLLEKFWGPIPWLLELAVILCILIRQIADAFFIGFLLLINTFIAFYNELDSQKALQLLKRKLTIKAKILRGSSWVVKEARELVPGDVIIVGLGDVVPADVKIISGSVSADQSALTGESLPAELGKSDVLFTGSIIKRGEVKCVVVNTGARTYFGRTVELVNIAKPKSKQEEIMFKISRYLVYAGAIAFAVILCYSLFNKIPLVTIATFAVLFIGGGIPAALPVMFTISQAKGATELSNKKVLVTKLDSIENAASVDIICLDKTGTITQNQLEISELITFAKFQKKELIQLAALASSAESKDSIDSLIISYAKENSAAAAGFKQVSYTPFEPSTKRAEAVVNYKGKKFKVMKGAPQMVLSLCKKTTKEQSAKFSKQIDELSLKGFRVLAIAKSDFGNYNKLTLVGLLALSDPLRPDSKETIIALKEAGIKPIMLTGDNIAVAREIAKQAGIGNNLVRISEIKSLPQEKQAQAVLACDGIAEIYPEDKYWVVKLLQSTGKMVGMTGDGVNDAPALKQAELGIAVSSAADVAKAAASMVLTEPGTKIILDAVRTSREAYQRMLTWTLKKIARSIQFMIVLAVGFFIFKDVVVSIAGLMLLTVVNDFMTMSLAADNSRSSKNPNTWNLKNITLAALFLGVLFCFIELALLYVGIGYFKLDLDQTRTLVLLSLVYTGQFGIIIVRERGRFYSSWPSKLVWLTIILAVVMFTLMAAFGWLITELALYQIAIIFAASVGYILLIDLPKVYAYKKLGIS